MTGDTEGPCNLPFTADRNERKTVFDSLVVSSTNDILCSLYPYLFVSYSPSHLPTDVHSLLESFPSYIPISKKRLL